MKKDLFDKKRNDEDLYKIKKIPYQKDDMHKLKELFNTAYHTKSKSYASSSSGSRQRKVKANIKDQRVTFKMSYSKTIQSHKKYIENYLVQKEKEEVEEKPVLFGSDLSEYKKNMDDLNFKCIISPENQNIDLTVLAKEFIKKIENITGYKFYWEAAIHNNTAHKHVHICINGKDQNNKKVQFQKEWIRNTMRETLSYIATQMIGERTPAEIEASKKCLPQSKRWTTLDSYLEKQPEKININNLPGEIQNRLVFLNELKLAHKLNDKYYSLDKQWKEVLTATGRYNTYLENYIELKQNLQLYSGEGVRGKVIKVITFDKDESWNDALIIQNNENKNIYVPVWQLQKENILGKEVSIKEGGNTLSRHITDKNIHVLKRKSPNNDVIF